jgi:hypothetical protein
MKYKQNINVINSTYVTSTKRCIRHKNNLCIQANSFYIYDVTTLQPNVILLVCNIDNVRCIRCVYIQCAYQDF